MNSFDYIILVLLGANLILSVVNLFRHYKLNNFTIDKIAILSKESSDTEDDSLCIHDAIGKLNEQFDYTITRIGEQEDKIDNLSAELKPYKELLMKHETYLKDLDTELVQNTIDRNRLFNEGLNNILNFSYDDVAQINKEAVYVEK